MQRCIIMCALLSMLALSVCCAAAADSPSSSTLDSFKLGMDAAQLSEAGASKLPELNNYMAKAAWLGAEWNVFIVSRDGVAVTVVWSTSWQSSLLASLLKIFEDKGYAPMALFNNSTVLDYTKKTQHPPLLQELTQVNDRAEGTGGVLLVPPPFLDALNKASAEKLSQKAVFAAHRMFTCYTVSIDKSTKMLSVVINTPDQWAATQ